jgi:AsmA protein
VDLLFQDGEIRSINIAQMVRNLTQGTLNGWQENKTEKTDLTELSGLFKINAGVATTDNLKLFGPLVRVNGGGNADLSAKTLQFKLDTKLVMSLEGQGGPDNPIGFGVPVMATGNWASPQIYPDIAGILDHPDAAYAKLRELGVGLFGNSGGTTGNSFLKDLGNLFNNKVDQAPAPSDKQPPPQDNQTKESQTNSENRNGPLPNSVQPNNSQNENSKPKDTGTQDAVPTIDKILKGILGK